MRSVRILPSFVVAAMAVPALAMGPPEDACTLLTPTQISAVLGTKMSAGEPVSPAHRTSCKWLEAGVDPFKAKTVIVSIVPLQGYEMGKSLPAGKIQSSPVSGVGEEAYITSGSLSYGATISVKKNGAAFRVTVRGYSTVADIAEKEKALAAQVRF